MIDDDSIFHDRCIMYLYSIDINFSFSTHRSRYVGRYCKYDRRVLHLGRLAPGAEVTRIRGTYGAMLKRKPSINMYHMILCIIIYIYIHMYTYIYVHTYIYIMASKWDIHADISWFRTNTSYWYLFFSQPSTGHGMTRKNHGLNPAQRCGC